MGSSSPQPSAAHHTISDHRGAFISRCSFRTYCYTLARHAVVRIGRERGRSRHLVALPAIVEELAAPLRSSTPHYLRTASRRKVAQLRAALDPDDRQLLVLRVNRKLAWDEIARVMCDEDAPTAATLARHAAALRKRFERLKARLRDEASRSG